MKIYDVCRFFALKFFSNLPFQCLGIAITQDTLYMVHLAYDGKEYEIVNFGELLIPLEGNLLNHDINSLVDSISLYCRRENFPTDYCVLALTEDEFSYYRKVLPPVTQKKLAEILHWEMEASFPESIYTARTSIDEGDGIRFISAMKNDTSTLWKDAFQENEMQLRAITFFDDVQEEKLSPLKDTNGVKISNIACTFQNPLASKKWQEPYNSALIAAFFPYMDEKLCNFLQTEHDFARWDWCRIELFYTAMILVIFGGYFFLPLTKYFSLREDFRSSLNEYQSLLVDCQEKARFDKEKIFIKEEENHLAKLFHERKSLYSMLTELSMLNYRGMRIDSIEFTKEKEIKIAGEAKNYPSIYDFLEECELEEIFSAKPVLEETKMTEDGNLHFLIRVSL